MYANLAAFAVVVLIIAFWTTDRAVLIPAVIVSGIFIGVNNTITTHAVMTVSPVEKPVASAAYSFVRFIGGGLAPSAAGRLVLATNIHVPFFIGAGAIVLGIVILSTAHGLLTEAERVQAEQVSGTASAGPAVALVRVAGNEVPRDPNASVILAAIDGSPTAAMVTEAAARLAAAAAASCTSCTSRRKPWPAMRAPTARTPKRPGRWSGTIWTSWRPAMSPPKARSCGMHPITAPPGGWWPNTPTPSGPARS